MISSACVLLCVTALAAGPAADTTARFAVIIGQNRGPPDLPVLRYADDDAVRLHEFMVAAGVDSTLLAAPDAQTQAQFPAVADGARPATRTALVNVLDGVFGRMRAARDSGMTTELVFAFAGHGRAGDDHGGAIFLEDGPLSRADLAALVVTPAPADYIHVIIDACDSYFMVAARGGEGSSGYAQDQLPLDEAHALMRQFMGADGPMQDARTGFLVSTNQAAQAHEYDGFRAGVFSHVIRGAMAGAADTDGDGRIEYSEVLAYASAASQDITDPQARLSIYGRPPPRNIHRAVMDLGQSRFRHFLRIGPGLHGRLHVEDARALRYADVHKPAGTRVLIALVDAPSYRVVGESGSSTVTLRARGAGALDVPPPTPGERRARGMDAVLREELFSTPFDASYYRGFVSSRGLLPARTGAPFEPAGAHAVAEPFTRPPMLLAAPGLGALGVAAVLGAGMAGAGVVHALVNHRFNTTLREQGVVDQDAATQMTVLKVVVAVMAGGGIMALAMGAALVAAELLLPRRVGGGEAP